MANLFDDDSLDSKAFLFTKVRSHFDTLSIQVDKTVNDHRDVIGHFSKAIVSNYIPGSRLPIIAVCTGNSRRSMLAAIMGNIAAAYLGFLELRFFSGGTAPSAFNPRTIECLKVIGVEIVDTGDKGASSFNTPSNDNTVENLKYTVRWGKLPRLGVNLFESIEFSKVYNDAVNPKKDFVALMVCNEAEASCPNVNGAVSKISMPFHDPKEFDDTEFEALKYNQRRDEIGGVMLASLSYAKKLLLRNQC